MWFLVTNVGSLSGCKGTPSAETTMVSIDINCSDT
jgi:hypothetical protein